MAVERVEKGNEKRHRTSQAETDMVCANKQLVRFRRGKGQAAVQDRYFSGRNSSTTASCSGTSGKKARRWQ